MRDLAEVLEKIIKLIPDEYLDVKERLTATKTSSMFSAPELQSELWREAANILNGANFPIEDWSKQTVKIFTGR